MYDDGVFSVHLEPTARCNAKCPMCARTDNQEILNNLAEISYDQFVRYFPADFVKCLKRLNMCGNYGDPAAAKDIIKIHDYVHSINPDIQFIFNSNGGIRNEQFWSNLATYYPAGGKSAVFFAIDGLEDTNHIYRVGVKWSKLINNVKAFNNAGGRSIWSFIPFRHNEHQVEEAEQYSKQINCEKFNINITTRFKNDQQFTFNSGILYPPLANRFQQPKYEKQELECVAELKKQIYVDAWARVWPCCWTGVRFRKNPDWPMWKDSSINSLKHKTIEQIIYGKEFNQWVQGLWVNKNSICNKKCTLKSFVDKRKQYIKY